MGTQPPKPKLTDEERRKVEEAARETKGAPQDKDKNRDKDKKKG